jgi:hypothetical protein
MSGAYMTDCGNHFNFNDDSATENGVKFCMYCGKPMQEIIPGNTEGEE